MANPDSPAITMTLTRRDVIIARAAIIKSMESLPDEMPDERRAAAMVNFGNTLEKFNEALRGLGFAV